MVEIIMYTGNTCGKCKGAKINLENLPEFAKENLVLIEKNIDENEENYKELTEKIGVNKLPTFIVDGDFKNPLVGFEENFGKIQEVLGL